MTIDGGTSLLCKCTMNPILKVEEEVRDPQRAKLAKAAVWRVGSKRKRDADQVEESQKVKRLRKGEWWPSEIKPAPQRPAPQKRKTEGQQKRTVQKQEQSADLQEQLAAARERAAKAEAERATAARDLARTQALTRLAHAAEQDAIRERRTLRTQKHHVRAERDDLVAKAIIAKQKARWLRGMASKQARVELKQMRDDREARQTKLLSQSDVGRQLAAGKETVRELSNKLIKQRTWRKEAAAIFEQCGVRGPSFKPNTASAHCATAPAPAQCATPSPVPAEHASSPLVPAQRAMSLIMPARHASSPPVPAQCATLLFLPAQDASSPPAPARRALSPLQPNTPPLFKEQVTVPQLPIAQLFSALQDICLQNCS